MRSKKEAVAWWNLLDEICGREGDGLGGDDFGAGSVAGAGKHDSDRFWPLKF